MAISNEEQQVIEAAEAAVTSFNTSTVAIRLGLEALVELHSGGDFTITVGMDDGRNEPWPVTVHAIYNDVDAFTKWDRDLDVLLHTEEQEDQIAEDIANYVEAVAAGHGDWHLGTTRLARRKEQNA